MFDVCTTGDTAHIDTILSSCHTRKNLNSVVWSQFWVVQDEAHHRWKNHRI